MLDEESAVARVGLLVGAAGHLLEGDIEEETGAGLREAAAAHLRSLHDAAAVRLVARGVVGEGELVAVGEEDAGGKGPDDQTLVAQSQREDQLARTPAERDDGVVGEERRAGGGGELADVDRGQEVGGQRGRPLHEKDVHGHASGGHGEGWKTGAETHVTDALGEGSAEGGNTNGRLGYVQEETVAVRERNCETMQFGRGGDTLDCLLFASRERLCDRLLDKSTEGLTNLIALPIQFTENPVVGQNEDSAIDSTRTDWISELLDVDGTAEFQRRLCVIERAILVVVHVLERSKLRRDHVEVSNPFGPNDDKRIAGVIPDKKNPIQESLAVSRGSLLVELGQ